ncbi:HTTM domain-containing protein [Crateriforma conspicua]|uniref:HTTM domain-containing protein n=1 Tax=Crateriforma conspicua TaxID=2527996 RepID=UPI001189D7CB|nr:HTTM domain-containing protein [Crateriforma conspicua]QDV65009.1 hypothetical protein Mal65_41780 [Crateriforma conspicua]
MIGAAMGEIRSWLHDVAAAWDRFWFCGRTGETLAVIRIATGVMLLYSHLVLAKDLMSFVGPDAWIDNVTAKQLHDGAFGVSDWARSYLWHIDNASLLWAHQALAITASALMAVGFLSRLTVPLAWFLNLMYVHRLTGALFGLDQIMTYSAMYLSLAPCGAVWSVDAWLRRQGKWSAKMRDRWLPANRSYVSTNVATRLFQIHVCVIYLFGGLAKARGEMWWDGTAVWFAVANYEYQSWDMTWMGRYPRLFSLLTHTTLFWEVFYCALVWPRLTRPIVLAMAVAVHGGIALFLGMITFGVMMIVANMIFVPPDLWRRLMGRGAHEKTPVKA